MQTTQEGLKREVGVWGLSANIVNIMIGAGIFVLPAIIAETMGASGVLAYLFCGLLIGLVTLCFAEAGSKVTHSGGAYAYVETAFGPYPGFLVAIFGIIGNIFANAAVSNALVEIIGLVFPIFKQPAMRVTFLFILFSGLAVLNIIGVKQGIGLVKIITVAKLIPLILLIVIGWKDVQWANLAWETEPTIQNLGEASLILFFGFMGVEVGLTIGGEIKNPQKTVPRAIFIGISGVLSLYILIQLVSQGILGKDLPNFTETPLAEAAQLVFGPVGYTLLFVGAGISMFGMISGSVLNTPRVIFRLSRDNMIPISRLASIHHQFKTPYLAILIYAGIGFILACVGGFRTLAVISSAMALLLYFGVSLSVIGLRRKKYLDNGGFKIPFGYTVPILSAGIILFFLSNLTEFEIRGMLTLIAVLTAFYFLGKVYIKLKNR
ncbi:amino acid transporter [Indibacter alkaliphilus LW1]|uniref:Amino acid transporter n=1 Tax=Indibacter alkaliphilus (strain CCUG 57479 / KCTC 22604 / LW1) TaxID=1189612 RepID=S2DBR8_INDAL|nr:APC family permease [Indibacter alkaliphilus]EOZ96617.1 amino acid transporter [Indibacter alkaliphilus LW1]